MMNPLYNNIAGNTSTTLGNIGGASQGGIGGGTGMAYNSPFAGGQAINSPWAGASVGNVGPYIFRSPYIQNSYQPVVPQPPNIYLR